MTGLAEADVWTETAFGLAAVLTSGRIGTGDELERQGSRNRCSVDADGHLLRRRALVRDHDAVLAGGAGVRLRVERGNLAEAGSRHGSAAGHGGRVHLRRVAQNAVEHRQAQRLRRQVIAEIQRERIDGGALR